MDILVGSDYYWDLITGRVQRRTHGPMAIDTRLGWILTGPISISDWINMPLNLMTHKLQVSSQCPEQHTLNETLKLFWKLKSFGIPATDRSLYDEFCNTAKFSEGRYEVGLPWKMPRCDLSNNYELSLRRLKGLLCHLRHNPDILHEYDIIIQHNYNRESWGLLKIRLKLTSLSSAVV